MGVRIGLIGFGEVGGIFATDLLAGGAERVAVYDLLFEGRAGAVLRAKAEAIGASARADVADTCRGADIVISAVTAASAAAVAGAVAPVLEPGQILFDINSASPATKRASAALVAASGASFVEGAVMASVPGPRLGVPILAGGPDAERMAGLLNPLGTDITPVTTEAGRASAIKLCRSIVIKGMETILGDCSDAADRWGVKDQVFASLAATYPGLDWPQLAADMRGRVRQHGVRRAAEMREAALMLAELGLSSGLAAAIADRQEAGADRPETVESRSS